MGNIIYSANAIRQRYLYHTGKKSVQSEPRKAKEKRLTYIKPSRAKPGKTVTVEIDKSLADDLVALAKKGAFGSGYMKSDFETILKIFLGRKVIAGRRKLKKMMGDEENRKQLEYLKKRILESSDEMRRAKEE